VNDSAPIEDTLVDTAAAENEEADFEQEEEADSPSEKEDSPSEEAFHNSL
jgi:hypothetical protein